MRRNSYAAFDEYGLRHLAAHLVRARRWDALARQLLDFDFLYAKVDRIGPQQLVLDFDMALASGCPIEDLSLIRDALLLSSHALSQDSQQLSTQLRARLMGKRSPTVDSLLDQVDRKVQRPWLRLLTPLSRPGESLLYTLTGHSDRVNCVLVATDETTVISASSDHLIKVWDLEERGERFTLEGHESAVTALALTSDEKLLVSGDHTGIVKIWNLEEQQEVANLVGHEARVEALCVTPGNRKIVSASRDGTMRVWDMHKREVIHVLQGPKVVRRRKRMRPPSQLAGRRSWRSSKEDYEETDYRNLINPDGESSFPVMACALYADGKRIASGIGGPSFKVPSIGVDRRR